MKKIRGKKIKTQYFKLTDIEINDLFKEYTLKYGKALLDDSLPFESRKIEKLVTDSIKDKTKQEGEIRSVCQLFLEYLFRSLKELALIIYLGMAKCEEFSQYGEDRVTISFIRNILNIPNYTDVTWVDVIQFELMLDECDRRNCCKSGEEYKAYCNNFTINLFGRQCSLADIDDVANELFELLDMKNIYLWETLSSPWGIRFALGFLEKEVIAGNEVLVMRHEYVRSPQLVLSIAAEVFRSSSIIRRDSVEVIFEQKWHGFFDQSVSELKEASKHPYSTIREGLKRRGLFYADASNKKEVTNKKDAIIAEIISGISLHEAGHHTSYLDLTQEGNDFRWAISNINSIGSALIEALADYAPKGPLASFSEMNQKDATRNLYFYCSDYFFIDADEEDFFDILTDIIVGPAISFLLPNGMIDLDRFNAKRVGEMYVFFQERYNELVSKLISVIKSAQFDFGIKKQDFSALELRIEEMHKGTRNEKPIEELRHSSVYWCNAIDLLRKFSQDGWEQYEKTIAEEKIAVEKALLNMITDNNGEKYHNCMREFILAKAAEIDIIEKPSNASRQRKIQQMSKTGGNLFTQPYTVIDSGRIKIRSRKEAK